MSDPIFIPLASLGDFIRNILMSQADADEAEGEDENEEKPAAGPVYKVGDPVQIIAEGTAHNGDTGVITEVGRTGYLRPGGEQDYAYVQLDMGCRHSYHPTDLRLLTTGPTPPEQFSESTLRALDRVIQGMTDAQQVIEAGFGTPLLPDQTGALEDLKYLYAMVQDSINTNGAR